MKNVLMVIFFANLLYSCKKSDIATTSSNAIFDQNIYVKGIGFQEDFFYIVPTWKYYNTDTVYTRTVKFLALDSPITSCKWNIGAGEYNMKAFNLEFPASFLITNTQIPINLSITYKTISGADTTKNFTKILNFANPCNVHFNGDFIGLLDTMQTPVKYNINTCAYDLLFLNSGLYIKNISTGCGRYFDEGPDNYQIGGKEINFSGSGSTDCGSPIGNMMLKSDSIFIRYEAYDNINSTVRTIHSFKGKKQ